MGQVCSGTKEESSKGGILDVPSSGDASESPLQAGDNGNNYSTSVPSEDSSATGVGAGNGAANNNNNNTSAAANANAAADENNNSTSSTAQQRAAEAARADAERRKRRELWIVNGAARGMVAVRSTRGSTGYYDQGFASLLAQHLEQTTSFPDRLPLVLPPNGNGNAATTTTSTTTPNETTITTNETTTTNNAAVAPDSSSTSEGTKTNTNDETDGGKETTTTKKCTFYDRLARPPWEGMDLVVADETGKTNTYTYNNTNSNSKQLVVLQGREASAAQSGDPHKLMDALAESLLEGPYTVIPAKQQLFAGVRPMVENLL